MQTNLVQYGDLETSGKKWRRNCRQNKKQKTTCTENSKARGSSGFLNIYLQEAGYIRCRRKEAEGEYRNHWIERFLCMHASSAYRFFPRTYLVVKDTPVTTSNERKIEQGTKTRAESNKMSELLVLIECARTTYSVLPEVPRTTYHHWCAVLL